MNSDELKALRKGMGYTQEGLAKVLGVARKTVNEMENGGPIDTRTEIAVLAESRRVKLIQHVVWVEPSNRNTYVVIERKIRDINRPGAMLNLHGVTRLFGEFKRRDHAYRWCAALHKTDNARDTRKLAREREAEIRTAA